MLGKSIWDDTPFPCLLQLREEFLKKYSAFWSNGHQIERDVKEAEYCQNMKRSEEMASVYSISRSVLVPAVNEITKLRRKEIVGEELDPKKRNDNKSKFVSYTALTELDKQADIINRYPLSHPLSNNPSHCASIKHLLLKNIYKNERI